MKTPLLGVLTPSLERQRRAGRSKFSHMPCEPRLADVLMQIAVDPSLG